ncbi:hypothetical protein ACLB2K_043347 [Fragaria x ananassa]
MHVRQSYRNPQSWRRLKSLPAQHRRIDEDDTSTSTSPTLPRHRRRRRLHLNSVGSTTPWLRRLSCNNDARRLIISRYRSWELRHRLADLSHLKRLVGSSSSITSLLQFLALAEGKLLKL